MLRDGDAFLLCASNGGARVWLVRRSELRRCGDAVLVRVRSILWGTYSYVRLAYRSKLRLLGSECRILWWACRSPRSRGPPVIGRLW